MHRDLSLKKMRFAQKLLQASLHRTACVNAKKKDDVLMQMVDHYGKYSPSPLSLRQFLDFGNDFELCDCFVM